MRLKEKTLDRGPVWQSSGASKVKEYGTPTHQKDKTIRAKKKQLSDLYAVSDDVRSQYSLSSAANSPRVKKI
jgi:hypothetical protein